MRIISKYYKELAKRSKFTWFIYFFACLTRLSVFHLVQCQVQSKDRLMMTTRFICYFIYLHLPHRINMTERKGKNIYLSGFHTRCLYWVARRSSPRSHNSPSPPTRLMTSQSLPPSSASSVMIRADKGWAVKRARPSKRCDAVDWDSA